MDKPILSGFYIQRMKKPHVFFWTVALALVLSFARLPSVSQANTPTFANSRITIGPSVAFLGLSEWSLGTGPILSYIYRHDPGSRFHFGVDSGFIHWADSRPLSENENIPATAVPVLLTLYYHFKPNAPVKPYLALSGGIATTWIQEEILFYPTFLLKPGLEFRFFYIEPKVGLMNMNFIFVPTLGIYLDLI